MGLFAGSCVYLVAAAFDQSDGGGWWTSGAVRRGPVYASPGDREFILAAGVSGARSPSGRHGRGAVALGCTIERVRGGERPVGLGRRSSGQVDTKRCARTCGALRCRGVWPAPGSPVAPVVDRLASHAEAVFVRLTARAARPSWTPHEDPRVAGVGRGMSSCSTGAADRDCPPTAIAAGAWSLRARCNARCHRGSKPTQHHRPRRCLCCANTSPPAGDERSASTSTRDFSAPDWTAPAGLCLRGCRRGRRVQRCVPVADRLAPPRTRCCVLDELDRCRVPPVAFTDSPVLAGGALPSSHPAHQSWFASDFGRIDRVRNYQGGIFSGTSEGRSCPSQWPPPSRRTVRGDHGRSSCR